MVLILFQSYVFWFWGLSCNRLQFPFNVCHTILPIFSDLARVLFTEDWIIILSLSLGVHFLSVFPFKTCCLEPSVRIGLDTKVVHFMLLTCLSRITMASVQLALFCCFICWCHTACMPLCPSLIEHIMGTSRSLVSLVKCDEVSSFRNQSIMTLCCSISSTVMLPLPSLLCLTLCYFGSGLVFFDSKFPLSYK